MTKNELFSDIARMGTTITGLNDGEIIMAVAVVHYDWFAANPQEVDGAEIIRAWKGRCPFCDDDGMIETDEGNVPCTCEHGERYDQELNDRLLAEHYAEFDAVYEMERGQAEIDAAFADMPANDDCPF